MTFKNKHLSYSRLSRFEQCPLSFKLHYIKKQKADPGVPLRFGKAIHGVLEVLVREHMEQGRDGALDGDRAADLWQQAWAKEGLSGVDVFHEGLEILKAFIREQGILATQDVLAIEREFHLPVGPFDVLGYIDRVDRVDDETVEVIDYKTNRMLFTRDEVDTSLQMSLYHLAAKQLWPWSKKVRLTFHMLRYGIRMTTERTADQLDAATAYVETMGRMTEAATEFPARLNTNCIYCDHRAQCPAYRDVLEGHREIVCKNLEDLDAVASEREEVAQLAKILYARKRELEDILKARLKDQDELVLSGVRYKMFNTAKKEHPLNETVEVLARMTGRPADELVSRLASIDNKALDQLIKELGRELDRPKLNMLKAELEATAHKTYSPRFWAKAVSA